MPTAEPRLRRPVEAKRKLASHGVCAGLSSFECARGQRHRLWLSYGCHTRCLLCRAASWMGWMGRKLDEHQA